MPDYRPDGDRRVRLALAVVVALVLAYAVVIAAELLLGVLAAAVLLVCYLGWRLLRALERFLHVRADEIEARSRPEGDASDGADADARSDRPPER